MIAWAIGIIDQPIINQRNGACDDATCSISTFVLCGVRGEKFYARILFACLFVKRHVMPFRRPAPAIFEGQHAMRRRT
jgi:hypothetical protein